MAAFIPDWIWCVYVWDRQRHEWVRVSTDLSPGEAHRLLYRLYRGFTGSRLPAGHGRIRKTTSPPPTAAPRSRPNALLP